MIELRPYQTEALAHVATAEARGSMRQLGVAATGMGKTIMFAALAQQRGGRTLILAHRDELVSQAKDKLQQVWPGVDVGIVKGSSDQLTAQVVVASVQTLSRQNRLDRMTAATMSFAGDFDLVVVDEAHHAAADTYRRILDRVQFCVCGHPLDFHVPVNFGLSLEGMQCSNGACTCTEIKGNGPLVLGVTATPDRGDGRGLNDLFDEISFEYDMLWGIRSGYLCEVRGRRVMVTDLDLSKVKVRHGDFDMGEVGARMEAADTQHWIVEAWMQNASTRQTIVFTPTVAMAEAVADEFRHNGVRAESVSGVTDLDVRRDILRRYAAGEVQVVSNCAVLTEGYDDPRTDCIVIARPTKSRALFAQMIGRGTRRHPEKDDLLVLDVVGATLNHSLVTIASLFGLDETRAQRMEDEGQGLTAAVDEQEQAMVAAGQLVAVEADLFRQLREKNDIAWIKTGPNAYDRPLGDKYMGRVVLRISEGSLDGASWSATLVDKTAGGPTVMTNIVHNVDFETAQGKAEDYIRKHGSKALTRTDAPWRALEPSESQINLARKLRIAITVGMTKGDVSDAIDAAITAREARKGR